MKNWSKELRVILAILLIEVITVPIVIAIFKLIEPKKVAAVIAASLFIVSGAGILFLIRSLPAYWSYMCYWVIHVHLFVFSVPMLLSRIFFWDKDFENIKILIFTGPEFHKLSEKGYLILMIVTVIDLIRAIRSRKNVVK